MVEVQDLKLDGNAIGGLMLELFGADMTGAGIVVRCRHCESVMVRIVQGHERTWIDFSGTASLQLG